jgi:hypothetical protein
VCRKNYGEIYYYGSFCALDRFEPWVVLCRGSFYAVGHFDLRPFCAWAVLSLGHFGRVSFRDGSFRAWAVLSLGHFVMGRLVCVP